MKEKLKKFIDYNTKYKYSLDVVAKKILSEDDHDLV